MKRFNETLMLLEYITKKELKLALSVKQIFQNSKITVTLNKSEISETNIKEIGKNNSKFQGMIIDSKPVRSEKQHLLILFFQN